jgi:signal peptidase I
MSEPAPPPPPSVEHAPPRRRTLLWIGLSILIPVVALVVASGLVLQAREWRSFSQGSGSMLPTLEVGDRFFVDQQAYRDGRLPDYGDIIVFLMSMPPDAPPASYVKRVVGLPGDRLRLEGGVLSINGKVVGQQLSGDFTLCGQRAERLRERMPNGASYEVLRYQKGGPLNNAGPYVVPAGSYFVMGDNRDNSLDSRSWNDGKGGFIPAANIIGRANYVYWVASSALVAWARP